MSVTRPVLFGVPVDPLTMEDTIAALSGIVATGTGGQHVVINASKVVMMSDEPRLRGIVERAALVNADGMSVVWAGRLLGVRFPERVAGIDLMWRLLAESEKSGWGVYFLGAREEVVLALVERVRREFPSIRIAGFENGYFDDDRAAARRVRDSGASIVFIGMSSPKKEYFVSSCEAELRGVLTVGVGGSFDVYAGVTQRAPEWMQRAGLEWFHRLVSEPRRMWKRYLVGNSRFLWLVLRERMRVRSAERG